jgi:Carboxypeptidase regulatory-like domain
MERVKRPAIIFACCLLLASTAVAESVEVGTAKAEESSRSVRITVVLNGKPLKLAKVEFCTTTGEQTCFTVFTGDDGTAVPHALALTTYHVSALFEDGLSSDLYLHISSQGKATSFAMDLTPSFKAAQAVLTAAEKLPIREIVREFTGSLQDPSGAMIPGVNINVVRKGSADKGDVLRLKADANGHFSAPLTDGAYIAVFSSQGFRTEIVPFEVAAQGEKEMLVKLQIGNVTQSMKVST